MGATGIWLLWNCCFIWENIQFIINTWLFAGVYLPLKYLFGKCLYKSTNIFRSNIRLHRKSQARISQVKKVKANNPHLFHTQASISKQMPKSQEGDNFDSWRKLFVYKSRGLKHLVYNSVWDPWYKASVLHCEPTQVALIASYRGVGLLKSCFFDKKTELSIERTFYI